VTGDGNLFFAGWSPGGPDDTDFKMPTFDDILKDDTDGDGALSKAEAEKTGFKDLFDNQDSNKDGKLTRDEWDTIAKFAANSKSSAFALKPGGTGNITQSGMLWQKTKGLPYVSSAILYRGQYLMVKDGCQDGRATRSEALGRHGWLLCLAGRRERQCLFHFAR
jgi:outer membrane protein assembly factor BamB